MGVTLSFYSVDIEHVKSSFGSGNTKLIRYIIESPSYSTYQSQSQEWKISLQEALETIILGRPYKDYSTHSYGYALITIVAFWGTNLIPEGDYFKLGTVNEEIEKTMLKNQVSLSLLDLLEPIYDFSMPLKDFPLVGGLSKSKMLLYREELEKIQIRKEQLDWENDEYNDYLEAIYFLRRAVKKCINSGLQWITFGH